MMLLLGREGTGAGGDGTSPAPSPGYVIGLIGGSLAVVCLLAVLPVWLTRSRAMVDDIERAPSFRVENLNRVSPPETYREFKLNTQKGKSRLPWSSTCLVCVICLDSLQGPSRVRCLPCGHVFHSICILMWFLRRHTTCPICKSSYVPALAASLRSGRSEQQQQQSRTGVGPGRRTNAITL